MEFRCRLGTPGGEIIEGTSTSPTARRGCGTTSSRRGCASSRCSPGSAVAGWASRRRGAGGSRRASSSSSTRNWRRCSRPGMPLVQSLDILRAADRRTRSFKAVLDDVHEQVRAGTRAVRRLRGARGPVSRRLHRVADGRREERQPRGGAAALRRLREGDRGREAPDGLGADLPGGPDRAGAGRRRHHRAEGRAGVRGLLRAASARSCRWSTRVIVAVSTVVRSQFLLLLVGGRRLIVVGVCALAAAAGAARAVRPRDPARCRDRADRAEVRDLAAGADAGDAARRRHPARQRDRDREPVDRQPVHGGERCEAVGQRVREGESFAAALARPGRLPGRGRQDGGGRRVDRRAAGDAEQPGGLLRRGDRDRPGPVRHARRAGAAGRHGHRHRGPAARAVHAAVPV